MLSFSLALTLLSPRRKCAITKMSSLENSCVYSKTFFYHRNSGQKTTIKSTRFAWTSFSSFFFGCTFDQHSSRYLELRHNCANNQTKIHCNFSPLLVTYFSFIFFFYRSALLHRRLEHTKSRSEVHCDCLFYVSARHRPKFKSKFAKCLHFFWLKRWTEC